VTTASAAIAIGAVRENAVRAGGRGQRVLDEQSGPEPDDADHDPERRRSGQHSPVSQ
jgi:hypothetical protein